MLRLTIFLLLFVSSYLHAQCEPNCPNDQEVVFLTGQIDSSYSIPPSEDNCTLNVFHTIRGPKYRAGTGIPGSIDLLVGTTTVKYTYTNDRFGNFTDTLTYLPDGDGAEYSTPFMIDNYPEGTTVASAGGLTEICMLMEHSYLGDLEIWVRCPNGEELVLHEYSNTSVVAGQTLGGGLEDTETPDELWLYCWTAEASLTMEDYILAENIGNDEPMPAVDYAPEENFSSLATCPINGEWSIRIRDNIVRDQGYIGTAYVDFGDNFTECSYNVVATFTSSVNNAIRELPQVNVFPNPVADRFELSVESTRRTNAQVVVYNAKGQKTGQESIHLNAGANAIPIATADWPEGVYIVRLVTDRAERSVRIVKR